MKRKILSSPLLTKNGFNLVLRNPQLLGESIDSHGVDVSTLNLSLRPPSIPTENRSEFPQRKVIGAGGRVWY